jgi:hypothetical protein
MSESGGNPNAKNNMPGQTSQGLYGFTDGTWPKIYAYWISQFLLLGYGLYLALSERQSKTSAAPLHAKQALE